MRVGEFDLYVSGRIFVLRCFFLVENICLWVFCFWACFFRGRRVSEGVIGESCWVVFVYFVGRDLGFICFGCVLGLDFCLESVFWGERK